MPIKLPIDGRWSQTNTSDKFGSIWASKNINLDEEGYIKLSPRSVSIVNQTDTPNFGDANAIGRFSGGNFLVSTVGKTYNLGLSATTDPTPTVNSGANNPTGVAQGGGVFFQNLWHATTDTTVVSRPASTDATQAWTSRITSLTSAVPHRLCVFSSRQTLIVSNGNVAKQYDTSYSGTTDLTIPSDFVINGMAYNNGKIGLITELGTSTAGQNAEARFFVWDGSTTGASSDASVGSDKCIAVCAYKSSFVVLTRAGQLLYWNGGGFEVLASFPFYYEDKLWTPSFITSISSGYTMVADGDVIYLNVPNALTPFSRKDEIVTPNMPGGVWCYDPKAGLYHRYSGSISKMYYHAISSGNVNTSTDTFTTSATIPDTGSIARITDFASTNKVVGGLREGQDYYVIKASSTTFKLATTKANAISGTAIDITAADTQTTFFMFDLVDYSTSRNGVLGTSTIALIGERDIIKTDLLIGGRFFDNTMTTPVQTLAACVPFLENRGWVVTSKVFAPEVTDHAQKLFLKFRPLRSGDSIIVKYRERDVVGLPTSSATLQSGNWTGANAFYTTQDLSEAKDYLDNGGELECEIPTGAGGGSTAQITAIDTDDDITYSVTLAEDIIGAASSRKCEFIINNWNLKKTITSDDVSPVEIPLSETASWSQFKVELRGSEVTIEELNIITDAKKRSR